MSQHTVSPPRRRPAGRIAILLLAGLAASVRGAGGPVDAPKSSEPRVEAGKCLSPLGLVGSEGTFLPYARIGKGETIHTRDLLVALPGFTVALEPAGKAVSLTLRGNLPDASAPYVAESAVVLHDTKAFDLDVTLVRGRVVVTNTRAEGAARVWLRAAAGVALTLPEPGDSVAFEVYGRWPVGEPFSRKRKPGDGPLGLWEVHCLKGRLEIRANKTTWAMSAAPGAAYFHGDTGAGPAAGGPQRRATPPAWADPKAPSTAGIKKYSALLQDKDLEEVGGDALAIAAKEKDAEKASALRKVAIHAMIALDESEKVAELLGDSKTPEVRRMAVAGLRHWIGANDGRDLLLYDTLQDALSFTPAEAETAMQLLHSPFDRDQAETYETLIAFLKHRKQAIRELAHWHLVRLAPEGGTIPYDAGASDADRAKAAGAWKKLIPDGELPPEKKEGAKKKDE